VRDFVKKSIKLKTTIDFKLDEKHFEMKKGYARSF
jgi:hypothetical protein